MFAGKKWKRKTAINPLVSKHEANMYMYVCSKKGPYTSLHHFFSLEDLLTKASCPTTFEMEENGHVRVWSPNYPRLFDSMTQCTWKFNNPCPQHREFVILFDLINLGQDANLTIVQSCGLWPKECLTNQKTISGTSLQSPIFINDNSIE